MPVMTHLTWTNTVRRLYRALRYQVLITCIVYTYHFSGSAIPIIKPQTSRAAIIYGIIPDIEIVHAPAAVIPDIDTITAIKYNIVINIGLADREYTFGRIPDDIAADNIIIR